MESENLTLELKGKLIEHSKSPSLEMSEAEYSDWLDNSILRKFDFAVNKLEMVKGALDRISGDGQVEAPKVEELKATIDDAVRIFGALLWQDDNPAIWLGDSTSLDTTPASNWTTGPQSGRTMKRVVLKP